MEIPEEAQAVLINLCLASLAKVGADCQLISALSTSDLVYGVVNSQKWAEGANMNHEAVAMPADLAKEFYKRLSTKDEPNTSLPAKETLVELFMDMYEMGLKQRPTRDMEMAFLISLPRLPRDEVFVD